MDEQQQGFDWLKGLFDLGAKAIDARTQIELSRNVWRDPALYGVDEYGRPYYRGMASPALGPGGAGNSPLLTIGIGILAATLIVWAIKS